MNSNPCIEGRREWDERYADLVSTMQIGKEVALRPLNYVVKAR